MSCADASEADSTAHLAAPASADEDQPVVRVKEEVQEAESISAVISTVGLPEEVADDTVATEESATLDPAPAPAELDPTRLPQKQPLPI